MTQPDPEQESNGAGSASAADLHPEVGGFGHSRRRVTIELLLIAAVLIGVPIAVIRLAGSLAGNLLPWIPLSVDQTFGEQAQAAMTAGQDVCDRPELERYVESIARPLVDAAESALSFQFQVVGDETVNAFALPGGYVTINLGLLNAAESGEEVAGVVAHEIQHAILRHSTSRLLTDLGGLVVLSALFGGTDLQAPASAITNLAKMSYGRDQEAEADRRGIELLQRAGIDPRGMVRFFERLKKSELARPPELLSTHPDPGRRAELAVRAAASSSITLKLSAPPKVGCH